MDIALLFSENIVPNIPWEEKYNKMLHENKSIEEATEAVERYEYLTQVSDLDLCRHSVGFKSSQPLIVFNDLHNQIFRFSPSDFSHNRYIK